MVYGRATYIIFHRADHRKVTKGGLPGFLKISYTSSEFRCQGLFIQKGPEARFLDILGTSL